MVPGYNAFDDHLAGIADLAADSRLELVQPREATPRSPLYGYIQRPEFAPRNPLARNQDPVA